VYQIYLFWNDTLHVSDGLCAHHQHFKTVHTATVYTDTAICVIASRQQFLFDKCLLLHVQSGTADDGRKDRPKHVECHSKINKFDTLVYLVGCTIEIYYDARPYERQISESHFLSSAPRFLKDNCFLEGGHALSCCQSGNSNMWLKVSVGRWRSADRGKTAVLRGKPVPLPPQMSLSLTGDRTGASAVRDRRVTARGTAQPKD